MNNRKLLIVILVLIVSAISFARSFLGLIGVIPWHYGYSDVFNEDRINPELAKKVPYLESPIEYPVITGFFIYFMWRIGGNLFGYAISTWIFLTLSMVVTALMLDKLTYLLKIKNNRVLWFFVFAPSLLFFGIFNWDIIAVMLMVFAIYFFYKERPVMAGLFLSLGFNAKLFPILLLPIMLLKTDIKNAIKMALVFLAVSFILNGYFIINSFDVWKATYLFHSLREPNIDSIWTLTNLSTSAINLISMAIFLLFYIVLIYHNKKYGFISLSFASILLFLLFNKIFSPQYLLWLLPFFVLTQAITRKVFYSLEAINLMVFFLTLYFVFVSKEQIFLTLSNVSVITRSLLLAYIVFAILKTKTNIKS